MALAYKELDIEKAYSIFKNVAYSNQKIDIRNKAWALRNLARIEAYEAFDAEKALEYFEEVVHIDDKYYFEITGLREELDCDTEEIEDSYEKIVTCDPNNVDAYLLRAGGLDDFQKAIDLGGSCVEIYSARARYKERTNDITGALEDYTTALSLDPKNSLIHRNRADLKDHKLNDFSGAISDYDNAIANEPNDSLLFRNRAFLKIKIKEFTGALEDLDIAIRLSPLDEYLYKYKAGLYEKAEAWTEALHCYNMSIVVAPNNKYSYLKRVNVYEKLHRYVEAKKDIEISNSLS